MKYIKEFVDFDDWDWEEEENFDVVYLCKFYKTFIALKLLKDLSGFQLLENRNVVYSFSEILRFLESYENDFGVRDDIFVNLGRRIKIDKFDYKFTILTKDILYQLRQKYDKF